MLDQEKIDAVEKSCEGGRMEEAVNQWATMEDDERSKVKVFALHMLSSHFDKKGESTAKEVVEKILDERLGREAKEEETFIVNKKRNFKADVFKLRREGELLIHNIDRRIRDYLRESAERDIIFEQDTSRHHEPFIIKDLEVLHGCYYDLVKNHAAIIRVFNRLSAVDRNKDEAYTGTVPSKKDL